MSKLAIIPARGGSKRIPKKNIKDFLGAPIISYAIRTALDSGLFDEVMVSTDSEEIAEIAKEYGAKVPFVRSAETASDFATTMDVLEEVVSEYSKAKITFDYVCCIYPCTPLLSSDILSKAFTLLQEKSLDCVFPILEYSFPIQRAVRLNSNDLVEMIQPEHLLTRSQDLESSYHDAGQFYFLDADSLVNQKKLLTDKTGYIVLSEFDAQDIDNPSDWKLAELKYQLKNQA